MRRDLRAYSNKDPRNIHGEANDWRPISVHKTWNDAAIEMNRLAPHNFRDEDGPYIDMFFSGELSSNFLYRLASFEVK